MKNIFIISGPSGAGEDTVMEKISEIFDAERIINTTSRLIRPGESQGNPYYFISKEEFKRRIAKGEFIESEEHYNGNIYGVLKKELERIINSGKVGLWKVEYKGVISIKKKFPEIKAILLTAPLDILEKRIRKRDDVSEDFIKNRMEYTKEWMKHTDIYDYVIENEEGKLDETIKKVAGIIKDNLKNE